MSTGIASAFPVLFAVFFLSGCVAFWTEWSHDDGFKDLPIARGKTTEAKRRTTECPMCTTGRRGETAIFAGSKKYYLDEIGRLAVNLLKKHVASTDWMTVGYGYKDKTWKFIQSRVFLICLDPVVVVVVPWKYKSKTTGNTASYDLYSESSEFRNLDIWGKNRSYAFNWPDGVRNIIEIRSTLPSEAMEANIISENFESKVVMPNDIDRNITLDIDGFPLVFTREAGGEIRAESVRLNDENCGHTRRRC